MVIWRSGPDGCFSRGSLAPQPGAARRQESDLAGGARVLFLFYPQTLGTSPWAGKSTPALNIGPPSRIGRTETSKFLSRLVDHIKSTSESVLGQSVPTSGEVRGFSADRETADDIIEWHNFAIEVAKARSIVEDYLKKEKSELRDTTKFTYLRYCLTGNALNAIDGLAVRAANYSAAIEILKSRFGRRDLTIQTHIRKLLDGTPCNHALLKTSRKFYDEVVLHIRSLEVLGKNPSSPELTASEVLLEIFKLKVHLSTRKRWEALILSEPSKASNLEASLKKSPPRNGLLSVAALHLETKSFEGCMVIVMRRRMSSTESTQDRWKIATRESLCFRCLQRGHKGNRCPETKRCDYPSCRKTHHKLLYSDKETHKFRTDETLPLKSSTEKDEGTARAILQSDDGNQLFVTCLFDSGCQGSLIRLGESHTVVQHHSKRNKDKWPKAAEENGNDGMCERIEAGLTETAGFCLTKLSSNEPTVLSSLSEKDVASECKARMALGIVWHNKEDVITFPVIRVARPDQQMTKRGMLSVIMKIFDLLGYLSPFLVKAKVCYKYCGIKELIGIHLPQNMLKDWQDWIAEIPSISEIRLRRCLLPVGTD
ncbi:hypothetical protein T02_1628 [Trichinella nativa]|uniref:CCHC-type domain-containing protein n=1 Tax=Trichinella nativa TaxID=6335 RepID=A0A0V1L4V2_9BILA|nr:hypothetical protein T02_1628 [Trichinella nativa]